MHSLNTLNINLLAVREDKLQAEATIGPEYYPFQIHFNAEWKPMVSVLHKVSCLASRF